ncbi:MAG: hypothetical protein U5J64_03895 [Halobacteriales archaeon]|nr:hypothetical protein [Halobacteriales archaeon]
MNSKKGLKIHGRRWRIELSVLVMVLLFPGQAAAHGGGGGTSWHIWASFLSLGVGTMSLVGGLYLDQRGTDYTALADLGVLGGAGAIVLSAVLYWLV